MATEARRALDTIWSVVYTGSQPDSAQWRAILTSLEPFRSRTWLDGANSRATSNSILSLVWVAIGDAERELGRPFEAAEAYRTAYTFRPQACIADEYLKLVHHFRLAEHYEFAIRNYDEGVRRFRETKFWLRLLGHIMSLRYAPLAYPRYLLSLIVRPWRRRAVAKLAARRIN